MRISFYEQRIPLNNPYGYSMGGLGILTSPLTSTVDRMEFPFDSGVATHTGNLTQSRRGGAGCNSSNYAYYMGCYDNAYRSTIERITFPFDSGTASSVGDLSQSKHISCGVDGTDFTGLFN